MAGMQLQMQGIEMAFAHKPSEGNMQAKHFWQIQGGSSLVYRLEK